MLLLSGCSGKEGKSVPSLPENICWGAFDSSSVAPLLPTGRQAQVVMSEEPGFDIFKYRYQANASCDVKVDGKSGFYAFARRQIRGKGADWNYGGFSTIRIPIGDEGFIWKSTAASVFRCERPDLPTGWDAAVGRLERNVVLRLVAATAPDNGQTRAALTALMRRYVDFAKRELKCANGA
ncbi:hypothetical protein ACGFRG_31205 [Streptomyces sp. NPDC048696]|uniref:hypothetical protein n=1 Tax=Streptomyces sp. NPDC048696 TaxID=3365585 RepID=UPI003716F5B4